MINLVEEILYHVIYGTSSTKNVLEVDYGHFVLDEFYLFMKTFTSLLLTV